MRWVKALLEGFRSARELARTTSAARLMGAAPNPRAQAYAALREAELRGDTRAIGTCRMRLMDATHAELIERVWS